MVKGRLGRFIARSQASARTNIAHPISRVLEAAREQFPWHAASLSFKKAFPASSNIFRTRAPDIDRVAFAETKDPYGLLCYSSQALERAKATLDANKHGPLKAVAEEIVRDAEKALGLGPYSVTDKTTFPPSGDLHDYLHPAPYYWPNPETSDGLPYVKRDGQRVPGTKIYEPESDKYDRTRLQLTFDSTTALALAWALTGRPISQNMVQDSSEPGFSILQHE